MSPEPGFADCFGIENIPYGVASSVKNTNPSCVSRYEDTVIFLDRLADRFHGIPNLPPAIFAEPDLKQFAALPKSVQKSVREKIQELIRSGLPPDVVEPISAVTMHLPIAQVGDFTDFSCSLQHVQNASEAMTGTRSTPPSFFHQPIGYAGRCSSLEVSGTPVQRPMGQYWQKALGGEVVFGPSRKFDFELELACIIGKPVPRREHVTAVVAEEHIFGCVLLNDWSARDIQALEMTPLGPLNGKNAATTVSPWVITLDALSAFRIAPPERSMPLAPYLMDGPNQAYNIELTVNCDMTTVCESNASWLYWTLAQIVAHQSIGGCGLRTGDLLATGTVSGVNNNEHGCLLELWAKNGQHHRDYLEDGDTVTLSAQCGPGVGFGECTARILPAKM